MPSILIVIPARYHSTRLPGKPLMKIAGVEMVERVAAIAGHVCRNNDDCRYVVATDHERVLDFCRARDLPALMTPENCRNGTERCWAALSGLQRRPEIIINLQGDNPRCPPPVIQALINAFEDPRVDLCSPYVQLDWAGYETLMKNKESTPYSGTTVLIDREGFALAFSKAVIPAIRKVERAREKSPLLSPVRRHIGLYAYSYSALRAYMNLAEARYEPDYLEGLEQMRFLENQMRIKMLPVEYRGGESLGGVDSPEDVARLEEVIAGFGEFFPG
ncbi:MAG: 3-deoxy-manno-octulosonate cytidylyltransferase [Candidatus Adiutrix sp.]|jgi:3-deoxy-manno-octulosonate cytidylyltransferase (CMP-KDO synthetase)|nr:3-deoxy-manno-octulosonate cytidylyltransferase [Candidatus Adiutrix sp.]